MCEPISAGVLLATAVGTAAVGTAATLIQGDAQLRAQKRAAEQQRQDAQAAYSAQDRANNAANMKQPDINALVAAASRGGRMGNSSTFLTGAAGVNPKNLALGRASLLGA